jgi:prepilin-type N-terminal cleavage/methylation domain-containing protein
MTRTSLKPRPGMTLPEVIIALVLMGIIGTAATGVFISQSQLYDHQDKLSSARASSRTAISMLMTELRMLEQGGGLESASSTHITVLAPFAFGIICKRPSSEMVISRLPGDTMAFKEVLAKGSYVGYAYRFRGNGEYRYRPHTTPPVALPASNTDCDNVAHVFSAAEGGGKFRLLPGGSQAVPGTPVLLYQRVVYEFKADAEFGGRIGLFRSAGSDVDEPIAGPFDATAGFRFFVGNNALPQSSPPSNLSTVTGLELVLDGLSERPRSDGTHQAAALSTSVFFWNR